MPVPTCGFTQRLPRRFDFCGHNANQIRIIWTRAHLDVLEHPPVRFGRIWSSSSGEEGLRGKPDTHIHTNRLVTVMTIAQLSFSSSWAKKGRSLTNPKRRQNLNKFQKFMVVMAYVLSQPRLFIRATLAGFPGVI